nr:CrcB family protein [uncultured Microbacterium sp.]
MSLRSVLLVCAGGILGTAARLGLSLVIPDADGLPLATLIANVVGALLIGILTARVPATSPLRLLLGTGALGGFTTYSALAVGSVTLWADTPLLAIGYALGSVALGIAAAAAGLRIGRPRSRSV